MRNMMSSIAATAGALDAQRARMEVAVSNLANAEATRRADRRPHRRSDVVLAAVDGSLPRLNLDVLEELADMLGAARASQAALELAK